MMLMVAMSKQHNLMKQENEEIRNEIINVIQAQTGFEIINLKNLQRLTSPTTLEKVIKYNLADAHEIDLLTSAMKQLRAMQGLTDNLKRPLKVRDLVDSIAESMVNIHCWSRGNSEDHTPDNAPQ